MKYLFKIFFLLFTASEMIINGRTGLQGLVVLLVVVAIEIFRIKYCDWILTGVVELVLITLGAVYDPYFAFLYCTLAYDTTYKKLYPGVLPVLAGGIYFLKGMELSVFLLITGLCVFFAFIARRFSDKAEYFKNISDRERLFRYELEQAKAKLVNSSKEVAHLAEVRERNRIAREIHDNVGHSIAGILIQLQAAYKLAGRDQDKSMEIMKKSIDGLSDAVTVLRDTVHNIKPKESLGIEYIKSIIDNYEFCTVEFRHSGDLGTLPANQLEILCSNIKEALTNTSRHSNATRVDIAIDVNEKFTRLYIKDNGTTGSAIRGSEHGAGLGTGGGTRQSSGYTHAKEGLGLSGMRERIANIGGSISISSEDGFLIVCVIPRGNSGGGAIFEGTYSR